MPLSDVATVAQRAEDAGYESVWTHEVAGNDAFAIGSAIAERTSTVRIGTAVVPFNTRGPAMLAMSATTLGDVSKGRAIAGIGASSEAIVTSWNGQDSDRPLRRARETIEVLRLALSGERVDYEGECLKVKGFRLSPRPQYPVPIYLAALNPKMLELAGELADGVVLNLIHEDFVPEALSHYRRGAQQAGRQPGEVVMRAQTYVGTDIDAARDGFASAFAPYIAARGYNTFFTWAGFGESVEGVKRGLAAKDREATRAAISDELLDAMVVVGASDEVAARIERYEAAGVDTVAVMSFWPDNFESVFSACTPR